MGSLGGGNGDPPEGLPGLPPDWGPVTIPDDLSALADESAAVRRELRHAARRDRLRKLAGLPPLGHAGPVAVPSVRFPLVIVVLAVIATLTSLFLVTWSGPGRRGPAPSTPQQSDARATVPRLTLTDDRGNPISLRELLPAVLILAEGCNCAPLIAATAGAVPAGVAVIAIGRIPPALASAGVSPPASQPAATASAKPPGPGAPTRPGTGALGPGPGSPRVIVRALADHADALRTELRLPAPGGQPTVLLADRAGMIVRTIAAAASIEAFRADLTQLL
jgi:hypothetical protein